MKKLLGIVVLGLLMSGNAYANDTLTVNGILKEGFKITKEELIQGEGTVSVKILTLRKGSSEYAICTIGIYRSSAPKSANCKKP